MNESTSPLGNPSASLTASAISPAPIDITGAHATARVFAAELESSAHGQIRALCDQPFTAGSRIRVMPDCHAGKGCVVGLTMTVEGRVCPNLVGVDIGCGMEAVRFTPKKGLDFDKLDAFIRENIPSGFSVRSEAHERASGLELDALVCARHVDKHRAALSLGTLGGGNHFIEVAEGESSLWLIIHSGSRRLGLEVAGWYQKMAGEACKAQGIPYELSYLEGQTCADYLADMAVAQSYAAENRALMADLILRGLKWREEERFTTIHNYIDMMRGVLRKGAVSAREGERLLIPLNMRDGSLLCCGLGNPDWNQSAPHGAGRRLSRSEAKGAITLPEFRKAMRGIHSTCISRETIDESPMVYKDAEGIVAALGPTAEIVDRLRPLYNFKAGGE